MNRRGFIGSILALGAAPAIVRAESLMKIPVRRIALLGDDALIAAWIASDRTMTLADFAGKHTFNMTRPILARGSGLYDFGYATINMRDMPIEEAAFTFTGSDLYVCNANVKDHPADVVRFNKQFSACFTGKNARPISATLPSPPLIRRDL